MIREMIREMIAKIVFVFTSKLFLREIIWLWVNRIGANHVAQCLSEACLKQSIETEWSRKISRSYQEWSMEINAISQDMKIVEERNSNEQV